MKNDIIKISRGYRLKLSTHNLIKVLQDITQEDSDTVLHRSCMLYYKTIIEENAEQSGVPSGSIPVSGGDKSAIKVESNNNRNEN